MTPDLPKLLDVLEATWPPAAITQINGWTIRDGAGGGKRVSAATGSGDITVVEAEMKTPLFQMRGDQPEDAALEAAGYARIDPTTLYVAPVEVLATELPPRVTTFEVWEPLQIMREIWAEGGIGPARVAVMARVIGPKAGLFGRIDNKPAGAGFVAIHDSIAMVHALEVLQDHRRKGLGVYMMRQAAFWARRNGATHLALAVTEANQAANALYAGLGLTPVGGYHYRIKKGETQA
ncbi:MAG: GNAT family N-acetyltransferase [Pseudomonadota bacterium]